MLSYKISQNIPLCWLLWVIIPVSTATVYGIWVVTIAIYITTCYYVRLYFRWVIICLSRINTDWGGFTHNFSSFGTAVEINVDWWKPRRWDRDLSVVRWQKGDDNGGGGGHGSGDDNCDLNQAHMTTWCVRKEKKRCVGNHSTSGVAVCFVCVKMDTTTWGSSQYKDVVLPVKG